MIVYQAHNPITNSFYIGKTVKTLEHRQRQHFVDAGLCRTKSMFHKAIRKYGKDAFDWCILYRGANKEDISRAEAHWIKLVSGTGHRLYNLRPGGDGGSVAGVKNHNFGRVLPDDVRAKISKSLVAHYSKRPGTMTGRSGRNAPFFGLTHSEDARQKISKANRGSQRLDIIGASNPSARAIVCLTTGEEFATATEAAVKYDCDLSSIIKCCKGKVKTVKGRKFNYLDG